MRGYQGRLVILVTLLAAANAAGWAISRVLAGDPRLQADFSAIPAEVGGWQGTDVPLSKPVLRELAGDALLQRTYRRDGHEIDFWTVFGRDWRDLHSPEGCYMATGWKVVGEKNVDIPAPEGMTEALHARLFTTRKGPNRALAVYLFATDQGTTADRAHLGWALLQAGGGSSGLLIHAATAVEDGEGLAAAEVIEFLRAVYPTVGRSLKPTQAGAEQ